MSFGPVNGHDPIYYSLDQERKVLEHQTLYYYNLS